MAIERPPLSEAAAPYPTMTGDDALVPNFAERWSAWQAKGRAHDLAVRRKLTYAAPVVIIALSLIFYAWLGR